MGPTIAFFVFVFVAGGLVLWLMRSRSADGPDDTPVQQRASLLSRRERKLQRLREFEESIPPRPTIQELMMEEARDTGVETIPGGDGLELAVRLRVWHRDTHVRRGCAEGGLRYVVHEGVDPATATEDDVMLVCDLPADAAPEAAGGPADAITDGTLDEPAEGDASHP